MKTQKPGADKHDGVVLREVTGRWFRAAWITAGAVLFSLGAADIWAAECSNPNSIRPGQPGRMYAQSVGCGTAPPPSAEPPPPEEPVQRIYITETRQRDTSALNRPFKPGGSYDGGPGAANPSAANKAAASSTNTSEPKCGATTDKPVIIATGEKVLPQTDFVAQGSYGFSLDRKYRSQNKTGKAFGSSWPSSLDGASVSYTLTGCRWIDVLCYQIGRASCRERVCLAV